jgi:hypothetical protein
MCLLISPNALPSSIFSKFPLVSFLLSLESISSLAWRFWSPHQMKVTNTPTNNVEPGFTVRIPFTQMGHDS